MKQFKAYALLSLLVLLFYISSPPVEAANEAIHAKQVSNSGGLFCKKRCCGVWQTIGHFDRCTKCCSSFAEFQDFTAQNSKMEKKYDKPTGRK